MINKLNLEKGIKIPTALYFGIFNARKFIKFSAHKTGFCCVNIRPDIISLVTN